MFGLFRRAAPPDDGIAVVVSYASMEAPFLPVVLEACQRFTARIVVSQGERLFADDGAGQASVVEPAPALPPGITYVRYPVDPSLPIAERRGVRRRPTAYFHNLARWSGLEALRASAGAEADLWVLLLDADEVPDGDRFRHWFASRRATLDRGTAYKMANYWHYADVRYRARTWEDSIVLVHLSAVRDPKTVFGDKERDHVARSAAHCERLVPGDDGRPLFTHFSWCRSRRGLRQKLASWAHRDDKFKDASVDDLVARVLAPPDPRLAAEGDAGIRDIVHNYRYDVVAGDAVIERLHDAIAALDQAGE